VVSAGKVTVFYDPFSFHSFRRRDGNRYLDYCTMIATPNATKSKTYVRERYCWIKTVPRASPIMTHTLYRLKNRLLEVPLDLLTLVVSARLAVEGHERTEVELGRLEELDLADVNLLVVSFPALEFILRCLLNLRSGEGRCPG